MANAIPQHIRDNYEATDEGLDEIRGLTFALDMALDHIGDQGTSLSDNTRATLAKDTILRLLIEKLEGLDRLRAMEWSGQGGNTEKLTADEIALARGEVV